MTDSPLLLRPGRRTALKSFAALCTIPLAGHSVAQTGSRPIRIVVPFTAGSGSDSAARFFGDKLAAEIGQQVIVENRPGGNGLITIQSVKNAPADGTSILLGNISLMAINTVTLKNPGYAPLQDFTPISGLVRGSAVFCVPTASPHKTLAEMLAAARERELAMGTYSQGYQLAASYLASQANARFINVAYKGPAPLLTDLIGNQVEAGILDFGGALQAIQGGRIRALGIAADSRHPGAPDVPTVKESGTDYVHYTWVGLFARSETAPETVNRLGEALQKILAQPESKQFAESMSMDLLPLRPAEMRDYVTREVTRFKRIAEVAGIEPQ